MLVEVPSNIAIRGVGPAIWISVITFCWAMVSMGLAFSRSWISVAVCRAFFGTLAGVSDVSVSSLEKYLTNPFPGSLPRLRIFDKLLVQTKRGPETLRRLLSNGHSSVVLRQYSSKRHHPNRQAHKLERLALDLHCRRRYHLHCRKYCLPFECRLPGLETEQIPERT